MSADTLRRLQALRGTRTGSAPLAVLAQVQGDLRIVIEAVLELADENTPPASTVGNLPRLGDRIEATANGHRGVLVWADHPECIVPGWVWEDQPACCVADRDVRVHRVLPPREPAASPESPEPVTDEPAVGEQVTDRDGSVWRLFEGGWRWWMGAGWSPTSRTWGDVQALYIPLRATTDDDRRRVGLPVPAQASETEREVSVTLSARVPVFSATGALRHASWGVPRVRGERPDPLPGIPEAAELLRALRELGWDVVRQTTPQEPATDPQTASQPEDVSEDPETENGRESGAQGRIGWLRVQPDDEHRYLTREIPGGWTDIDIEDDQPWLAEDWPDAEFTPIRTLADDEVAVKRGVVDMVMERLEYARRDAMEDGRSATETALRNTIAAFTDSLEADR